MNERLTKELEAMGLWEPGMRLEPIEWFVNQSPPGALEGLAAYRLFDPAATPVRDRADRPWTPVLDLGTHVVVGPSAEMLTALLDGSGYFDQPGAFGTQLLTQFHRLAMDFYDGYEVREDGFAHEGGELVVTGEATRGGGDEIEVVRFETRVRRGQPARFAVV